MGRLPRKATWSRIANDYAGFSFERLNGSETASCTQTPMGAHAEINRLTAHVYAGGFSSAGFDGMNLEGLDCVT